MDPRTAHATPARSDLSRHRRRARRRFVLGAVIGVALTGSAVPALAATTLAAEAGRSAESSVVAPDAVRNAGDPGAAARPTSAGTDATDLPAHLTLALALFAAGVTAAGVIRRPERP